LPVKLVANLIEELNDTVARNIDKARATLPKDFPEKVVTSIANGTTQRLKGLALLTTG
jgi:hypothetical protein